jgi:hypothetical protein
MDMTRQKGQYCLPVRFMRFMILGVSGLAMILLKTFTLQQLLDSKLWDICYSDLVIQGFHMAKFECVWTA